jgi:inosine-uridine nucleoside N-ribohydrolase
VGPHNTLDLPGPETAPRKVIIDTDPGVDDALALLFAMRSPELKIEAITAVAGNVPLDLTVLNALRMVEVQAAPIFRSRLAHERRSGGGL